MVSEDLPPPTVFRLRLNQSYDAFPPAPGEVRFPLDGTRDRARAFRSCDAAIVVAELWRDGHIPEWVNIAVVDETGTATVIDVVCCGRFTNDDSRLYHIEEGTPPFHVLSPVLPPRHDGAPFSIHARSECWDSGDLEHLRVVAGRVWSFTLRTDQFDDRGLVELPELPNVEVFEHRACTLGADALSAFARFPRLRVLRLDLAERSTFVADAGEHRLEALHDLTIGNLPPRPWGLERLAVNAPWVSRLHLSTDTALWLGAFPSSVRDVHIGGTQVAGSARLPAYLDSLTIRLTDGTDDEIATLLDAVAEVRTLSLRGTPVSDAILATLERYDLERLNLVDTAVTSAALARLRTQNSSLRLLPPATT
jgi:hypothetical protein